MFDNLKFMNLQFFYFSEPFAFGWTSCIPHPFDRALMNLECFPYASWFFEFEAFVGVSIYLHSSLVENNLTSLPQKGRSADILAVFLLIFVTCFRKIFGFWHTGIWITADPLARTTKKSQIPIKYFRFLEGVLIRK